MILNRITCIFIIVFLCNIVESIVETNVKLSIGSLEDIKSTQSISKTKLFDIRGGKVVQKKAKKKSNLSNVITCFSILPYNLNLFVLIRLKTRKKELVH
jgi:hypothetical protein